MRINFRTLVFLGFWLIIGIIQLTLLLQLLQNGIDLPKIIILIIPCIIALVSRNWLLKALLDLQLENWLQKTAFAGLLAAMIAFFSVSVAAFLAFVFIKDIYYKSSFPALLFNFAPLLIFRLVLLRMQYKSIMKENGTWLSLNLLSAFVIWIGFALHYQTIAALNFSPPIALIIASEGLCALSYIQLCQDKNSIEKQRMKIEVKKL